jgi:hypothetical protein
VITGDTDIISAERKNGLISGNFQGYLDWWEGGRGADGENPGLELYPILFPPQEPNSADGRVSETETTPRIQIVEIFVVFCF